MNRFVMRLLSATVMAAAIFATDNTIAADDGLPAAIDRIRPAIVAIGTLEPTRNPAYQFRGTGFVVGDGTLVATNNHVVPQAVDVATREVLAIAIPQPGNDAIVREAVVVARDPEHDLVVLRIVGAAVGAAVGATVGATLPAIRIGDASRVKEGQSFAFTGFPIGGAIGLYPTTHRATVSAITPIALAQASTRSLDAALIRRLRADRFNIFQLDATAYPGNSGSPMFNIETGEVIAIINMVFVKGGKETALTAPSGISYAIPAIHLVRLLDSLKLESPTPR